MHPFKLNITQLLLLLAIMISSPIYSQNEYWGPDTTLRLPEMSYHEAMNHVYSKLLPYMESDILLDMQSVHFNEVDKYSESSENTPFNSYDYFFAYTAMEQSRIGGDSVASFFDLNDRAHKSYEQDGVIPLGLLHYNYSKFDSAAILSNALCWDKAQVKVCDPSFSSLFHEKELMLLTPLFKFHDDDEITFRIDPSFSFIDQTEGSSIVKLEIAFGDDLYYEFGMGEEFDAWFEDIENPKLQVRITKENGDVREFESSIEIELTEETTLRGSNKRKSSSCYQTYIVQSGIVNFESADRVDTMYVNVPLYNPNVPIPGMASGYFGVYYGCGNECGPIRKPYIIASGFSPLSPKGSKNINNPKNDLFQAFNGTFGKDHADFNAASSDVNNGANILYRLRNEGYDVIVIDFSIGIDYIQNAAAFISEVIKKVNREKFAAGNYFENICQGNSMGGVAMRYALAKMEKDHLADPVKHPHHHTRMFVANEAEMQGATIPLGIQFAVTHMTKKLPPNFTYSFLSGIGIPIAATIALSFEFDYLRQQYLDNPAARSLLVHHHSMNQGNSGHTLKSHPLHTQLFQELDALGYPKDCRLVGISDGSSIGAVPITSAFGECLLDVRAKAVDDTESSMKVNLEVPNFPSEIFKFKYSYKLGKVLPIKLTGTTITKKYSQLWSYAPGSYEQFNRHLLQKVADLTKTASKMNPISFSSKCSNPFYRAPFVTTISALDIQGYTGHDFRYDFANTLFFDRPGTKEATLSFGYPHNNSSLLNPKMVTPFDAVFASPQNEYHLQNPSTAIANFILLESQNTLNEVQNRNFKKDYRASVEGGIKLVVGSKLNHMTARQKVIIEKGAHVEAKSSLSIELSDGFEAKDGSNFSAKISPTFTSCYILVNLKRTRQDFTMQEEKSIKDDQDQVILEYGHSALFPNPTQNVLSIEMKESQKNQFIKMYNSLGQLIHEEEATGTIQMDVSSYTRGLYLIELSDTFGNSRTEKLILQ